MVGLGVVSGDGVLFGAGGFVCSDAAHGIEAGVGTAVGTGRCACIRSVRDIHREACRPSRGLELQRSGPRACAPGYILSPLRGWSDGCMVLLLPIAKGEGRRGDFNEVTRVAH